MPYTTVTCLGISIHYICLFVERNFLFYCLIEVLKNLSTRYNTKMQINEEQFKKFILDSGLVSKTDFNSASKISETKKQKIGDALLSLGKISETDLKRTEAHVL